ncbi:hypothetical protein Nepgr_003358 [Nepenthes gracilis]|uniref:Uncharacterized protein n=1 Tax=Nepenthes gracilis TaxID=150966 RepID=A0AAD3RZG6_NEPGR|nr:hypothetical protein Nepgr_003358 [Nepenthes gracilis]
MPLPSSLRHSPGREPRRDSQKRGRSLESGLSFKEKDDDLALFNEMQRREQENFLLQSTDDFEDVFSTKLKPFPDFKLGITIPVRGESSDLLNTDGDKNDYDWLLTPPDTPLFPSLDDEPAAVSLVHSGRPRSRPIPISRSSMTEKSYRSSRGSASPQRSSPSSWSGNNILPSWRRPSSAPHSSATPSLRHGTPSRRLSPPPPRSATPTPGQKSTGSAGSMNCSSVRGTSPIRTNRGNSESSKIKAWQSNIPGFSLEAPPNLRTSLADPSASYVRGPSPVSRNSRDSSSKFGRRSMSPTAPRSISSLHSHERDWLSSHSKGSLASSGDDFADSLQSCPLRGSEHSMPRRTVSGFPSNSSLAFSKKHTKTVSSNSTPKKFDSTKRQMDHRSPQNRFRPLLSSVPSSTLYSGKASPHGTMMSRYSSVTTSSNASSELARSGAPDTEGSDQNQDDLASEFGRGSFHDIQDEVFAFDKMDVASEDTGPEIQKELRCTELSEHKFFEFKANHSDSEESSNEYAAVATTATSEALYAEDDSMEVGSLEITLLCSRCGCRYRANGLLESEVDMCLECKQKELFACPDPVARVDVAPDFSDPVMRTSEDCGPLDVAEPQMTGLQFPDTVEMGELRNGLLTALQEENVNANQSSCGASRQLGDRPHSKVEMAEGPIMHGRNITVSAISYEDSSYARDSTTSMRSSVGNGSSSTLSSMDLTSTRHVETLVQQQLSSMRSDMSSKLLSCESSFSGTSAHAYQALGISTSTCEANLDLSFNNVGNILDEAPGQHSESLLALRNAESSDAGAFLSRRALSEDDNYNCSVSSQAKDTDATQLSTNNVCTQSEGNSLALLAVNEGHALHGINRESQDGLRRIVDVEESSVVPESSFMEENAMPDNGAYEMEVTESLDLNSFVAVSETEIDHYCSGSTASQVDIALRDEFQEPSVVPHQDTDVTDTIPQSNGSYHMPEIVEESTVMVEHQGQGQRARSLTLEEATDTILFCSSIIHNLAYQAASIAIEREKENLAPLEGSRPTVTTPGKPSPRRGDLRGRTPIKRTLKSQKPIKTQAESPSSKMETDDKPDESMTRIVGLENKFDGMKPTKLESKCNCTIM